jgi:hypothetical protein
MRTYVLDRQGTLSVFGPEGLRVQVKCQHMICGATPIHADDLDRLRHCYAFIVLADILDDQAAANVLLDAFKREVISSLPARPWTLSETQVANWLEHHAIELRRR